jgi:hypothetical protein
MGHIIDSKDIKNKSRETTPHAWALDNAKVLAYGVPFALTRIDEYEKALMRIYEICDVPTLMVGDHERIANIVRNVLLRAEDLRIEDLKGLF